MAPSKPHKASDEKIGYGMLGLYAVLVVVPGLWVYGWTFTSIFTGSDAQIRAQLQHGRMLIATEDRIDCRSYTFSNATSHLVSSGGIVPCENRRRSRTGFAFGGENSSGGNGGSFVGNGNGSVGNNVSIVRDSFNNR